MSLRHLILAASTATMAFTAVAPAQAQSIGEIGAIVSGVGVVTGDRNLRRAGAAAVGVDVLRGNRNLGVAEAAIIGGAIKGGKTGRVVQGVGAGLVIADSIRGRGNNDGWGNARNNGWNNNAGWNQRGQLQQNFNNGDFRPNNQAGFNPNQQPVYSAAYGDPYNQGGSVASTISSRDPRIQAAIDNSRNFPWFNDVMYQARLTNIVSIANLRLDSINSRNTARNVDIFSDVTRGGIDINDVLRGNARRADADANRLMNISRVSSIALRNINRLNSEFQRQYNKGNNSFVAGGGVRDEPPVDAKMQICEKRELDFLKQGKDLPKADACRKILGQ